MADEATSAVGETSAQTAAPEAAPAAPASAQAGADPQATDAAAEQPSVEKPDYKKLLREDPDLKQLLEDEANRKAQRLLDRQRKAELRRQAKEAVEREDADTALRVSERVAAEADDDEDDDVAALRRSPEYATVWQSPSVGDLHKQWADLEKGRLTPAQLRDWLTQEARLTTDLSSLAARARKAGSVEAVLREEREQGAKAILPALVEQEVQKRLQGVRVPPAGEGAGGGGAIRWTPERVAALTPAQYEEHRDEIHRQLFS